MYDMAQPNHKPGKCSKCKGGGRYRWGAIINGVAQHEGKCHSCGGKGYQDESDILRNRAYNRHKIAWMSRNPAI